MGALPAILTTLVLITLIVTNAVHRSRRLRAVRVTRESLHAMSAPPLWWSTCTHCNRLHNAHVADRCPPHYTTLWTPRVPLRAPTVIRRDITAAELDHLFAEHYRETLGTQHGRDMLRWMAGQAEPKPKRR